MYFAAASGWEKMWGKTTFGYFDAIIAVWLIIGLYRGRQNGMSQELLPLLQWLSIVFLAAQFYRDTSLMIRQSCGFSRLWSNVTAYLLIAILLRTAFGFLKKALGEKLVGSDVFGRGEYYLGMLAGATRFACMVIVLYALMNSRIYTEAEIAAELKEMRQSLESIQLPTYPTIQHAAMVESFVGRFVRMNMRTLLIASTTGGPSEPSLKERSQHQIDEVLGK